MALRLYPKGAAMTPSDFAQGAMDRPLSPWSTMGGAAADAVLQSPGLGTVIREYSAPDTGVQQLGRSGTRYRSAEEVERMGDTLYQTPEDYKASPYYREEIPYEKGMTAGRAKALADMSDTSKVRQFYSSKRPVASFVGTLAGSALDPINYIPIVGEVAYAASAARVGRIASRAFLTGADAAANTAIFGALTASDRARFGDDISWNAIGMNAAYSAMAGVVLGGAFGALRRAPKIEAPKVDAPRVDAPAMEAPRMAAQDPALTMGDSVTARFEPVRPVTVDDVFTRMETAQNRIKAAEVMNEAVDTLIERGEVSLGSRSQATIGEIAQRSNAISAPKQITNLKGTKVEPPRSFFRGTNPESTERIKTGKDEWDSFLFVADNEDSARNYGRSIERITAKPDAQILYEGTAAFTKTAGKWRKSENMLEYADRAAKAAKAAGYDAVWFKRQSDIGTAIINPDKFNRNVGDGANPVNPDPQQKSFALPPQEPMPAMLKQAEAKIDSNPKPDADPEQALIDRAIADAKEEGFDPETNEHDLEPEIDSLRKQEFLTAEEEQALAAADETYEAVDAWAKVMDVARTCVLNRG